MSTARHRGRRPGDDQLFTGEALGAVRRGAADLAWLLERGYADGAALKLVGDRYQLRGRQRDALARATASGSAVADRRARQLELDTIVDHRVLIDALNCLITVEAAIAGGMILVGLDGVWRDLASVHGTWRRVAETDQAIAAIGAVLEGAGPASVRWLIDRPVSNSGRLAARLRERAAERGWDWEVATVVSPDRQIIDGGGSAIAATSDSWILDSCGAWIDLPRAAIRAAGPDIIDPWIVDVRV